MTNRQIQLLLCYLGYYTGEIDGIFGGKTNSAIDTFINSLECSSLTNEELANELKKAVANDCFKISDFWSSVKHFKRSEFKCKCGKCGGYPAEPNEKLVKTVENVRNYFNAPVYISSGVRCSTHNRNVGGVKKSRHLSGRAVDFCVYGKSANEVLNYLDTLPHHYFYKINDSFIHFDI